MHACTHARTHACPHRVDDQGGDGRHERLHGRHEGEELALRGLLDAVGEEGAEVRVGALWRVVGRWCVCLHVDVDVDVGRDGGGLG